MIKLPRAFPGWMQKQEIFDRYWDEAMSSLEKTLNAIIEIPIIAAALEAAVAAAQASADTAQASADTAQAAADTAVAAVDAGAIESSIVTSYVSNYTPPLISVDSAGTVTIANHDRVYGNSTLNPTVAVTGASFATTGVAGDIIRVFYDQPSRAGGTVVYQYTIDPAPLPVQGGDRHSVGAVSVPGAGTNNGNGVTPPGFVEP